MNPHILKATALSRAFGARNQVRALRHASLTLDVGERVAVMGASGSGKSTLLQLIGLLDQPDAGSLALCGRAVCGDGGARLSSGERAHLRLTHLGFVFQQHRLIPYLTVRENVALPAERLHGNRRRALARADALLERVGLTRHGDTAAGVLSLGEAQRAAVARALINDPKLVLADEPTGALDSQSATTTLALLTELTLGAALLLVTHDPHIAASAHRTLRMTDGELSA